jgi:hypothetical protein
MPFLYGPNVIKIGKNTVMKGLIHIYAFILTEYIKPFMPTLIVKMLTGPFTHAQAGQPDEGYRSRRNENVLLCHSAGEHPF